MNISLAIRRNVVLCTGAAVAFILSACGGKQAPKVAADASQSANGTGAYACLSASNCPAIDMDFTASNIDSDGALLGYVNEAISWDITGTDLSGSGRTVGILLNKYPKGSTISPKPTKSVENTARIEWISSSSGRSKNDIMVIMRDLDRCRMMESKKENCNVDAKLSAYDKEGSIAWRITTPDDLVGDTTGGEVVHVSDPNCGQNATTDGQITGKMLQVGIGVLTGGVAGLPKLLIQAASGISGGQQNQDPTEC